MPCNDYGDLIEEWKVDLIRARARRFGFRADELPDLEQNIVMELLGLQYDPSLEGGASETTFLIAVIDRQLRQIRRRRARIRRKASYEALSLDSNASAAHEAAWQLSYTHDPAMQLDIQQALLGLTPAERAICQALSQGFSQAAIARATGRSKAAICNEVRKLRARFREWRLDEYLEK